MPAATGIRPFLKWAGGKRQLLRALRAFYPPEFGTYFEPFLGSGAVFFDLVNHGLLEERAAVLSDANRDLIGCYTALREDVDGVIGRLLQLERAHGRDPRGCYYDVRDRRFNPARRAAACEPDAPYASDLAAMLIYLNRTAYNGLFRLNTRGDFNVPAGRYNNPLICDEENLRRVATALRRPTVRIVRAPYVAVLAEARRDDLAYLDPPYAPTSPTSAFTAYTPNGFGDEEQRRLQRVTVALAERGCFVLQSNSTAPLIADLYDGNADARRGGLRAVRVPARRAINSKGGARGPIAEYIISNIPGGTPADFSKTL
jgi:DNA adenine methylase